MRTLKTADGVTSLSWEMWWPEAWAENQETHLQLAAPGPRLTSLPFCLLLARVTRGSICPSELWGGSSLTRNVKAGLFMAKPGHNAVYSSHYFICVTHRFPTTICETGWETDLSTPQGPAHTLPRPELSFRLKGSLLGTPATVL